MKGKDLISEFAGSAELRGGLVLFPVSTAIRFVERCKELKIQILGVDGFFLTKSTTQPSLEDSVDLSKMESERYELAIDFLSQRSQSGMFFEIVIPDE
jgi:hypothetical protein